MPPAEPYQNILTCPETGKISLIKCKNHKKNFSLRSISSLMRLIVPVFDNGKDPSLTRADFQGPSRIEKIQQREMSKIRNPFSTRLWVSVTITLNLRMNESLTCVTFGIVSRPAVSVWLGTAFKKVVLYHSRLEPI